MSDSDNQFTTYIRESLEKDIFVKITLSKPGKPSNKLKNVYIRLIQIKDIPHLSFTYRRQTNDQVKNFLPDDGIAELMALLKSDFRIGTLFTLENDIALKISKKGMSDLHVHAPTFTNKLPEAHDRTKEKRADNNDYLFHLGVTDQSGKVIPKMADKYRQINKYLEIIESLLLSTTIPKDLNIVDMGSGKGYLTFALYDFLQNKFQGNVRITGIELRPELVSFCNEVAQKCGFENLNFVAERIESFESDSINVLIALHACDTATDDALYKGLMSRSELIICAPCCHKQIRQQVKGKTQSNPLLKYGIFKERQLEMVTDTIRALILEKNGYDTKIFEFVSNEHTRKNIMLTASRNSREKDLQELEQKIEVLKNEFNIEYHYLEKKLGS